MSDYPEHERQAAVLPDAQVIGEFLDWLSSDGQMLGRHYEREWRSSEEFAPTGESFQHLLERYFEIDPVKIENEKRAMLEAMRNLNAR